jgi:hypothetical protein
MHILELVLQGVGRFAQSRKFPLKPGLNVVFGPTESGKTTLVSCMLDLLYPDRFREDEASIVNRSNPGASRAGLTIGSGKDIYRILKDYNSGQLSLTQYNPASQKYEQVSSDAVEIASILNSTFSLPSYSIYNHLFVAAADHMPSALPLTPEEAPAQDASGGGHTMPPGQGVPEMAPGMMPGQGMSGPGFPGQGTSAPGVPQVFPPGVMPPGTMPPGTMPPGTMPPGMAPGAVPGMIPGQPMPGMMPGQPMPGMMPGQSMPGMAPGVTPGGVMPGSDMDDGMTHEEREKKLTELREELKDAEKVDHLQYEIDGYQRKMFDVESKLKGTTQFDEFLGQAEEQLDKYPVLKRLPEKIDERLDKYKDLLSIQAQEVEKIDAESLKYDDDFRFYQAYPPLYKQQLFIIGASALGIGILAIIVSRYSDMGFLKFFGLASIAGLGLLFWQIWQHIIQTGEKNELEGILNELDERRESTIKRFQVEMAVIEKMMDETDSDSPEELKGKIQMYRELDAKHRSVKDRKNKLISEADLDAQAKKQSEYKEKIAALEEDLKKYPAFSMDINEMRREIKRLEKVIRHFNPNSPVLAESKPEPKEGFAVPDVGSGTGGQSPGPPKDPQATMVVGGRSASVSTAPQAYEQMVFSGAELFSIERKQLIKHIQKRYNLYIQALFGKRYSEARIDPDGSVALKLTEGDWVDFDHQTPVARDTSFLALQITLLEYTIQKHLLPVILDNPSLRLDETAGSVASKAFKRVGERTQVILLSAQRAPLQLADHSLELT